MNMLADAEVLWYATAALTFPLITFLFSCAFRGRRYIRLLTIIPASFYALALVFMILVFTDPVTAGIWEYACDKLLLIAVSAPFIAIILPFFPAKAPKSRPGTCRQKP